jgi:photosystem II stability/assembly factor-like uncharacterized protein
MAENLGPGVSYVNDPTGTAYDTVVFQKGKPPLDSELNLVQQISHEITRRGLSTLPSGWLTLRPFKTDPSLVNSFYTQDPATAIPELAFVNGMVVNVTNSNTSVPNSNIVNLGEPPSTSSQLDGVYLEVWRALLSPGSNLTNGVAVKPDPAVTIANLLSIDAVDPNHAWISGQSGLILQTPNAGQTWNIQPIDTPNNLNGIFFVDLSVGWVVGDTGIIGRTTNGGQIWNLIATSSTENFKSVFALSQQIAWLVGTSGTILATLNGVTWLPQVSGVTNDLNSVYFLNTGLVGWAVGADGIILKTVNSGANWIKLNSGVTANLRSVKFFDTNFGFAVGDGGIILRTSDGGATWINQSANAGLSVNYTDIALAPNFDQFDQFVTGEDVSSQANGTNKVFTVLAGHTPITKGDGHGTTFYFTATPTVTDARPILDVRVNGVSVAVDSVNGATGQIILHTAPVACAMVKVYFSYKINSATFNGTVWITGTNNGSQGVILRSDDLGTNFTLQTSNTGQDLNGIFFADINNGWAIGNSSIIRHTISGGSIIIGDPTSGWIAEDSAVLAKQTQRIFFEGNNPETVIYLNDDSINPNVNIETTKRVQVQYRITTADAVDPFNFPEAGLGTAAIVGLGPNSTGSFAFENMGPINGDYGLWRAKCANTVDGYTYAIPMFFVNRRNTTDFNPQTNANGQSNPVSPTANGTNIRPDQLTAARVVDPDILDVRRKVTAPAVTEMLDVNLDALLDSRLSTRIILDSIGGDKYGSQILQIDRVAGISPTEGGTPIDTVNASSLLDAVQGLISSEVKVNPNPSIPELKPAISSDTTISYTVFDGISHQNPVYFAATYSTLTAGSPLDRAPIPGEFSGIGTKKFSFVPNNGAQTISSSGDSGLNYNVGGTEITTSLATLTQVPSNPQLVKNYSNNGAGQAIYYQGIFDNQSSGKLVEQWSSGIPGINNYSIAYPGSNVVTAASTIMASTVDLHYFILADSSSVVNPNVLNINPAKLGPDTTSLYSVLTVSQVKNVTAGYDYKIANVTQNNTLLQITTPPGFNFIAGVVFEIVAKVLTTKGDGNVRDGATVNFSNAEKSIGTFCVSDKLTATITDVVDPIILSVPTNGTLQPSGSIIGVSSAERIPLPGETEIILPFCWVDNNNGTDPSNLLGQMHPITNVSMSASSITFTIADPLTITAATVVVTLQVLVLQSPLIYNIQNTTKSDGLLIGYYYTPTQAVSELPTTLTMNMVTMPREIMISNLGTGGSLFAKEPYAQPLINIPVNDPTVLSDDQFYNVEPMRFPTFSVDGGFVELPVFVPGSLGTLTFSNSTKDAQQRSYYSSCSKEFTFRTEGLLIGAPRKIFVGAIGRVLDSSDNRLLKGEYLLVIFSRNALTDTENFTGFQNNGNSMIAIYRLPNRPITRV